MKTVLLALALFSFAVSAAQDSTLQILMDSGIVLHDGGNYQAAISCYEKALEIEPKNAFVNYEMALSHDALGDVKLAIKYAQVASKEDSENGLQAIILLASIYDRQGKYNKSIKTLNNGIDQFGDYYLLWYNLGVTASSKNDIELARKAFEHAIKGKLDHANSHFALGRLMLANERRVEALYPLLFCVMLEPKSERSVAIYKAIEEIFAFGAEVGVETGQSIEVKLPQSSHQNPKFKSAELMMSLLQASRNLEKYAGVPKDEIDRDVMMSFLRYMNEASDEGFEDLYFGYYVPFFGTIAASEYDEAFFHYTRMASNGMSKDWCEDNLNSLQMLFDWLDNFSFEWEVGDLKKSK